MPTDPPGLLTDASDSVSHGPGTLSILNATAGANIERSPIVVMNGGPSQTDITARARRVPRTPTWTPSATSRTTTSPVPQLVDNAVAAALIRKHSVYIKIPQGFLTRRDRSRTARSMSRLRGRRCRGHRDPARLRVATYLVVFVEEVPRYRIVGKVLGLLDRLQLQLATTLVAKSVLPESHPSGPHIKMCTPGRCQATPQAGIDTILDQVSLDSREMSD